MIWFTLYMYFAGVMMVGVYLDYQVKAFEVLRNKSRTKTESVALAALLALWPIIPPISIVIAIINAFRRNK